VTDSVAVLSSLLDSLLDAAASLINLLAIRHALTPADDEHRFGHGKAEPLAGLAQSAFICGSALILLMEAIHRLGAPQTVQRPEIGIAVSVLAIVLSMGLRPCTGAILVLVLAFALDLLWVGVFAVMAMSLGTALALIAMGVVVIKARQWAMARLGAREGQAHLAMDGLAFLGGCAVLLLGTTLLIASFGPAHPLGL